MTGPRSERAAELVLELADTLANADELPDGDQVIVTNDPADLAKARTLQYGVVIVQPGPALTWPAPGVTGVTWQVAVVGKAGQLLQTWDRLDAILAALRGSGLNMTEAEPADFTIPDAGPQPGYVVTIPEQFYDN